MTELVIRDEADLRQGFAAFLEAAHRLERSHAELRARADAVDLQLARTNAELERTLAERDAVFRALPIGVAVRDARGCVTWTNAEADRLVQLGAAAGVDLANASDGPVDGRDLSVVVRRVPMHDGGELVLLEDRSRVVRLEREVDRLDRLAGLSELALGIAHEIRNPLNGVLGFAALLETQQDPVRVRNHVRRIVEGLGQVDRIVTAMLGFARSSSTTTSRAPLRQVVHEAATAAQAPSTRVVLEGDADADVDAAALTRVLANLIGNAFDAGASNVRIVATTRRVEHEIVVHDDGPGVSAELAPRLFRPFVTTKERGHGLGLALAARVVGFLNGRIELTNPGERGAAFRIRLPRVVAGTRTQPHEGQGG